MNLKRTAHISKNRKTRNALLLITLTAAAFIFKLLLLSERSPYLDTDEGYYLLLARNVAEGRGYGFNGLPNTVFPPFLPLLIAAVTFVTGSYQVSLQIITALGGTLLGLIALLVLKKKAAVSYPVFGAVLVWFISQLNDFLPVSESYVDVLYRGSDILNCCLIMAAVYCAVRLIEVRKIRYAFLAGGLLGLSYLTRPEGLPLFLILLTGLAGLTLWGGTALRLRHLLALAVAFVLLAAPYVLYLKQTTGRWMISGKLDASREYRPSLIQIIEHDDWAPFESLHYALDENGEEMNDGYWGYHPGLSSASSRSSWALLGHAWENYGLAYVVPLSLFPLYLIPFFLIGLSDAVPRLWKQRNPSDLMLFLLFPFSLALIALVYPIPRHHLFLVPVMCIYALQGLSRASRRISGWLRREKLTPRAVYVILYGLILALVLNDNLRNLNASVLNIPALRQRLMAEVMVSETLRKRQARTVMANHPALAVRAACDWQVAPKAPLIEILRFGRHKQVDHFVLPHSSEGNYHRIVDLESSTIPEDASEDYQYSVLEASRFHDVVRITLRE